jgi:dual-specificity kinase
MVSVITAEKVQPLPALRQLPEEDEIEIAIETATCRSFDAESGRMSTLTEGPRMDHHLHNHSAYQANGVHARPNAPVASHHHSNSNTQDALPPHTQMSQQEQEGRQLRSSRGRPPKPNDHWADFYKNGPPKEVIVIEDTPEPPQQSKPTNGYGNHSVPQAAPGSASKKRKYDDTVSQTSYKSQPSANGSSRTLVEASPSLARQDSNAQPGQKRKRVQAPSASGSDKRREVTIRANDIEYRGLSRKVTKASNVTVRVVRQVSSFPERVQGWSLRTLD